MTMNRPFSDTAFKGDNVGLPLGRKFNLTGNNKGLFCPFKPVVCQEGKCSGCQIYLDKDNKEKKEKEEN